LYGGYGINAKVMLSLCELLMKKLSHKKLWTLCMFWCNHPKGFFITSKHTYTLCTFYKYSNFSINHRMWNENTQKIIFFMGYWI